MTPLHRHVLLVDDDPELSWAVGRYLTRAGYKVLTCGDGSEALQVLESRQFDALVTDVQMPGVNGLALVEWVREHRPRMSVVVITAFGSPTIREVAMRKGAIVYLEKPLDPAVLVDVLQSSTRCDSFSGSIADIDLFDYIQLMLVTRREVVVEVSARSGGQGRLFIQEGDVVHAECDEAEGEEAFHRCLAYEGGQFTTLPWREPSRRSITERGEFLLMEAARKKDEAEHEAQEGGTGGGELDAAFDDLFGDDTL